jgi:hypothetical protein
MEKVLIDTCIFIDIFRGNRMVVMPVKTGIQKRETGFPRSRNDATGAGMAQEFFHLSPE